MSDNENWASRMTGTHMKCAHCAGDPLKMYAERITKMKANWVEGDLVLEPCFDRGVIQWGLDGTKWYCPKCVRELREKNVNSLIDGLL